MAVPSPIPIEPGIPGVPPESSEFRCLCSTYTPDSEAYLPSPLYIQNVQCDPKGRCTGSFLIRPGTWPPSREGYNFQEWSPTVQRFPSTDLTTRAGVGIDTIGGVQVNYPAYFDAPGGYAIGGDPNCIGRARRIPGLLACPYGTVGGSCGDHAA